MPVVRRSPKGRNPADKPANREGAAMKAGAVVLLGLVLACSR